MAPWWSRMPPIQPFPWLGPGLNVVQPTTPGYYSLADVLTDHYREKPPTYAYPRFRIMPYSFFNADWRYLDDPAFRDRDFFDLFKRIRFGDDNFMFTTGGEWRGTYANEVDSRLTGTNNTYYLTRTRVYGDLFYRDVVRIYAELINAQSFEQDLPPLITDQENANFLNLFADLKVGEFGGRPAYFRLGRQELLYGSERLISPLDWANTRRTFQGAKLFWQDDQLSLDAFVVQPVVPNASGFSSVNNEQVFSGVWGTYRPVKNQSQLIDLYYLNLDDTTRNHSGYGKALGTADINTVGSRWFGDKNNWLWDTEAMLQFGGWSNQGIFAKAYTMAGGYHFSDLPMTPQVWLTYDYASGDPDPGANSVHRTFNQLFPFGHYYFGMMDLVGRQNINDISAQLSLFPTHWISTFVQYHVLRLDSPKDALYNAAGAPIRQDLTGRAGSDVGEILTFVTNFHIDKHQDLYLQYSHLYIGDFIRKTGNGLAPDETYLMYSYRW